MTDNELKALMRKVLNSSSTTPDNIYFKLFNQVVVPFMGGEQVSPPYNPSPEQMDRYNRLLAEVLERG